MTDALGYAAGLLTINIGAEMIYVLQQRLAAMRVTEHKRSKVYDDIIEALLNKAQLESLYQPQAMPKEDHITRMFERIVGSTIFRMNSGSRDKLFRLMLMGVKYQVVTCQHASSLLTITIQRLEALRELASSASVSEMVSDVIERTQVICTPFTMGDWAQIRMILLGYLEGKRYKVSLFMQRGLQNGDGSYALARSAPVQYPQGVEQPGLIRYFRRSAPGSDVTVVRTSTFERPDPKLADMRLHANWTRGDMGRNLYLALTNHVPNTSPSVAKESITIYTWGRGDNGLLGHSNRLDSLLPGVVVPMLGKHVTQIALSAFCVVALAGDSVFIWGIKESNNPSKHPGRALRPTEYLANIGVCQIAASRSHILLRTESGAVWSWGFAGSGELGHGQGLSSVRIAKRLEALSHVKIIYVTAGKHFSFAIDSQGTVYGFGRNNEGQLGIKPGLYYSPVPIDSLTSFGITQIACAETFCYGLTKDGSLVYWGTDLNRSPSIEEPHLVFDDIKVRHQKPLRFASVACGSHHTLGVTSEGHVYAWGVNSQGQLGLGEHLDLLGEQLSAGNGAVTNGVGGGTGCAAETAVPSGHHDGAGEGSAAGIKGKRSPVPPPLAQVVGLDNSATSVGPDSPSGKWDTSSPAGKERAEPRLSPTALTPDVTQTPGERSGVSDSQAGRGEDETIAGDVSPPPIDTDQPEAGDRVDSPPRPDSAGEEAPLSSSTGIPGRLSETAGASSSHHRTPLAPKVASNTFVPLPERVAGISAVVQVAAGSNHSVALTKGGRVFTWGDNARGQLGHGDRRRLYEPQFVERLSGRQVRSVAVSKFLTCALVAHTPRTAGQAETLARIQQAAASSSEQGGDEEVWDGGDIPPSFLCPITYDMMRRPCFAMDGHTYEREAILAWFSQRNSSPMTGERLESHHVVPNFNLQSQIAEWRQNMKERNAMQTQE
eukprot:TRINITY_DN2217_c0_g1_i4.p1 TRINITY_DN2217_c0_g1~~TRINITY_DN2217_c0_g1_i4.p1  ORF type:complete len:942 (+),score=137.88 TRINITY_DN2217_c0_g1_i4:429-3254(+)